MQKVQTRICLLDTFRFAMQVIPNPWIAVLSELSHGIALSVQITTWNQVFYPLGVKLNLSFSHMHLFVEDFCCSLFLML